MKMSTIACAVLPLLCLLLPKAVGAAATDEPFGRPQVNVGDAWTYRQTSLITKKSGDFSYRVKDVTADRISLTSEGYSELYTADWNLVASSAGIKITPHEGYFDFPFEPGKTYPFKSERTVAKNRMAWEGTVQVLGWETIEVPAGTYRALRVDVTGSFGSGAETRRAQLRQSFWWVVEVRRWVRHDLWISKPGGKTTDFQTRTELIRFVPAQ